MLKPIPTFSEDSFNDSCTVRLTDIILGPYRLAELVRGGGSHYWCVVDDTVSCSMLTSWNPQKEVAQAHLSKYYRDFMMYDLPRQGATTIARYRERLSEAGALRYGPNARRSDEDWYEDFGDDDGDNEDDGDYDDYYDP